MRSIAIPALALAALAAGCTAQHQVNHAHLLDGMRHVCRNLPPPLPADAPPVHVATLETVRQFCRALPPDARIVSSAGGERAP